MKASLVLISAANLLATAKGASEAYADNFGA